MKQKFNPDVWLVTRKRFNPEQWLDKPKKEKPKYQVQAPVYTNSIQQDVEIVVQRIEACRIDLTCAQEDWVKMGFAFASEFGETGRNYFHRISRFYPGYNFSECDRQFDKCLKGEKAGVSIKSFFFAAKYAGINVFVEPE
ncbi:PriCT-2 domain-containing protein [Draconibacterium sp.]|nr:PriCT-2 domain-containing protein [Draconibacterium sp.]